MRVQGGWTYLLASRRNGTLYCGVTNNLVGRVSMHKQGAGSRFTERYGVKTLVWYEFHDRIESAIQRETSIKRWKRVWKLQLIEKDNPNWIDLFGVITATPELAAWTK